MSKRESYVISGTFGYAFVTPDNMSYSYNDKGNYVVKLYPDEKSLQLIEDVGGLHLLREPSEKDEGPYVNLSRKSTKPVFDDEGKIVKGEEQTNNPPTLHGIDATTRIGNGSKGAAQFRTYKGRGNKTYFELEGIRVDELQEFVPMEGESKNKDLLRIVE